MSRTPRASHALPRYEVKISVYDLLPQGKLTTVLWAFGTSLLHTGVSIGDKEYAFGGHDRKGVTGVYWTKPHTEPPGGTFRVEILHGIAVATPEAIERIVKKASIEFLGPSYNLLTRNCNHFTSHLVEALTGQPAPAYLNRAASIGVALPCVVPAGWVEPPECELEDQSEEARLTGATAARRHSVNRDDAWDENSSSEGEYTDEDEDERRRREQREAERRRRKRTNKVRELQGREPPVVAERAAVVGKGIVGERSNMI